MIGPWLDLQEHASGMALAASRTDLDSWREERWRAFVALRFDEAWSLLRRLGVPPSRMEGAAARVLARTRKRVLDLDGGDDPSVWLDRHALPIARRCLRPTRAAEPRSGADASPYRLPARFSSDEVLGRAVSRLPRAEREAVALVDLHRLRTRDAARLVRRTDAELAELRGRGRRRLRELLAAEGRGAELDDLLEGLREAAPPDGAVGRVLRRILDRRTAPLPVVLSLLVLVVAIALTAAVWWLG